MKRKVLLIISLVGYLSVNAQIKQEISKEPDTDLCRTVEWSVMVENLRNKVYELQLECAILKTNGSILTTRTVHYQTTDNTKYKFTSPTTWVKIRDGDPKWNDSNYVPEFDFFFNLMNKTIKPMTDEQLKKAIILNLDSVDKLFDK